MYGRSSTDPHSSICHSDSDSRHTGQTQWDVHMIGTIVVIFYVCLFLVGVGTILAFLSSWRDGCLHKDLAEIKSGLAWVFLRIKKFAQRFFNRAVYLHVRSYWMFYGLAIMFITVALSQ